MTQAITANEVRRAFRPSFFFWMTVVMAFFIFSGFGLTYWAPMATGSLAPLPPVVHLPGLFFFSWIVLLVVQSALTKRAMCNFTLQPLIVDSAAFASFSAMLAGLVHYR